MLILNSSLHNECRYCCTLFCCCQYSSLNNSGIYNEYDIVNTALNIHNKYLCSFATIAHWIPQSIYNEYILQWTQNSSLSNEYQHSFCWNISLEIGPEVQSCGKSLSPRRSLKMTKGVWWVNSPGKKDRIAVKLAAWRHRATGDDRERQQASKQARKTRAHRCLSTQQTVPKRKPIYTFISGFCLPVFLFSPLSLPLSSPSKQTRARPG